MRKRRFFQKAPLIDQSGFALIMVMSSVLALEIICLFLNQARGTQAVISFHRGKKLKSCYLAKAGVAHGLWKIQEDPDWRTQMSNLPLGDGAYTVSFTEDPNNRPRIGISSQSQVGGIQSSTTRTVHWLILQPEHDPNFWEADTYIKQDNKTEVNDEKNELKLKSEEDKRIRTLAKYNLKKCPLPNKAPIVGAFFSMYLDEPKNDSDFVSRNIINDVYRIHRVTASWVPHETSWKYRNDEDEWGGGAFDPNFDDGIKFSCIGWKTWKLSTMARYWMERPDENHGFIIECDAPGDKNDEVKFHSSRAGDVDAEENSLRPKLALYYLDARSP